MLKRVTGFLFTLLVFSCSSTKKNTTLPQSVIDIDEATKKNGLELISKNDCLTCHKMSEQLLGPSYEQIANKYTLTEQNINALAKKIIRGGSGSWGNLPMTRHSNLQKEDAETIVKYILSLKK